MLCLCELEIQSHVPLDFVQTNETVYQRQSQSLSLIDTLLYMIMHVIVVGPSFINNQ